MNPKLDFPSRPPAGPHGARCRVDLLAELPPPSLQALLAIGTRRRYRDGALVQQRGDAAHHALVLLSGRLRTEACTAGGVKRLARWMEPGEIGGLSSVLGNSPVPMDLVAAGAAEVMLLARQPLLDLLAQDAVISLTFARALSLRVNELFDQLVIGGEEELGTRVWATVRRLAAEHGQPCEGHTKLHLSQTDLAHAVGASRQRVNAELRRLQAERKIVLGYRWLEILEPG